MLDANTIAQRAVQSGDPDSFADAVVVALAEGLDGYEALEFAAAYVAGELDDAQEDER